MKKPGMRGGLLTALGTITVSVYLGSTTALATRVVIQDRGYEEVGEIAPQKPGTLEAAKLPPLSAEALEALLLQKLQLRERIAALVDNNPPSPSGLPRARGRETQINADAEFPGNPATVVIGRNNRNTQANSSLGNSLAEPAAANNALLVFAAGNTRHAEFSSNGGVTWTNVPLPAGPADAPIQLGDHDVVIDDASQVTFHSALYVNSTLTNGVVQIFVRRNIGPVTD